MLSSINLNNLIYFLRVHSDRYPTHINLNYNWSFGSLAFIVLVIQIISGLALAMHYIPTMDLSFYSVKQILDDVNSGYIIRYIHLNGASAFFFMVYLHMLRGLYYSNYWGNRYKLWVNGIVIFFLLIIIGFLGYVLVGGQMSFWGATVITNLASVVPFIGSDIVIWFWGGFIVNNYTFMRFFCLHFLLPFVLLVLVIIHLLILHYLSSSNPLMVEYSIQVNFYPYFVIKDLFCILLMLIIFFDLVMFNSNLTNDSDNYIMANPMVTPSVIKPEWYLLCFYAILRSIPNKLLGVIAMVLAILCILLPPFVNDLEISPIWYKNVNILIFLPLISIFFIILTIIGASPVEFPYVTISQISTFFYFIYFIIANYNSLYKSSLFFLNYYNKKLFKKY